MSDIDMTNVELSLEMKRMEERYEYLKSVLRNTIDEMKELDERYIIYQNEKNKRSKKTN